MNRDGALRTRGGSRRGDALIARLVKTMPAPRASSTSNPWLAQNWGVLVMAAATVATVPCLLGTTDSPRPGAMTSSTGVGHQSLFATPKSRGGISIAQQRSSGWSAGRALQEQTTVTTPVVQYGTNLQLFMCNPSPEEGNDASLVDEDSLAAALSKVSGLQQADADEITVAITTGPVDDEDDTYMCNIDGMLQWHAQITYSAADAEAIDTTPAVMAAQANDHVAYEFNSFKTALAGNINEYAGEADSVELSAADIVVATVGWIVTFPAEESFVQETATAGSSDGLAMGLSSDSSLWVWWVWLLYLLLVACCLVPLCCFLRRRREDDKNGAGERLDTTRKGRDEEGLSKIRGPEWGITELDFEGDYNKYQNQEMKREYDGAGRGIEPTAYNSAHKKGQQSVSAQAWMQQAGKKSAWAGQNEGQKPVVRRFDIDDEDHDDGVAQLRGKHPQYTFDVGRGGFGGTGGGESKS